MNGMKEDLTVEYVYKLHQNIYKKKEVIYSKLKHEH